MAWGISAIIVLTPLSIAQNVNVTARVDSNNYLIGDRINLRIEVERPSDVSIMWPSFADPLKNLEIVQHGSPAIRQSGQNIVESSVYALTAFDSGTYSIPSMQFQYTRQGDTTRYYTKTLPITVFVHSVPVDTTQDIKDIKPPLPAPLSFSEILPYLIGMATIGCLAFLVYYILKKRKKGESILPEPPTRPAHEIALEALRALEAEHLWQRGKIKEYHSKLTDIIRTYLERRFVIMALEMTTEEILSSSATANLESGTRETLKEILTRADLVKFAKFQPLPQEHEASLALAVAFVESTRQQALQVKQETIPESVS